MSVIIEESHLSAALGGKDALFAFLRDHLNWPLDPDDTFTFNEPEVAGRASAHAAVSRLQRFTSDDPFVIFLVEFQTDFRRGDLREILRGVRREIRERAAYNTVSLDEIVFVCATENYNGLRWVHFEEREGRQPRLRVFGFDSDNVLETTTLRTENLNRLELMRDVAGRPDWSACTSRWMAAWDVEKVTRAFFDKYVAIFDATQKAITGFPDTHEGRAARRLFTQRLFNRLLFVHFLSKRNWLTFGERKDYLFALWDGRDTRENFYDAHLSPLFFAGLNNPQSLNLLHDNPALHARIGTVPFLNGGLFEKAQEEKDYPGITIPDSVFENIFKNLFACYNFTITESSPDDVEVAVDPEMLGRVFEKLITREDREAKGAFYTPRSVVQFMCTESLKGYLKAALPRPGKPDAIERVVDRHDDEAVTVAEARILNRALEALRVVDPACGSGAYLLGMMQTLFETSRLLDVRAGDASARDDYDRKLAIIRRNLYGVDIDPFAANIAALRLWLSLIVDYRESDPASLPPLPNLDFKIRVGDSLAAPDPRTYGDIFRAADITEADAIQKKIDQHFHATDGTKATLFAEIQQREAGLQAEQVAHGGERVPDGVFDWRSKFASVFTLTAPVADIGGTLAAPPEPGGFHIVIANPPYGGTPVPDALRLRYFPRAEGPQSKDLYGIFMARALQLLAPGGQFCFVVSNTWRTIKSFKPLRNRLLTQTTVRQVIDLPNWIFDATVNTGIVTLTNQPAPAGHRLIAGDLTGIERGDWHTLEANLQQVANHGADVQTPTYARYTYPQSDIGTYENFSFFIASPRLYRLMSDPRFTKLGAIADVKVGLQTGDNEYYLRKREGVRGSYRILNPTELLTDAEIAGLSDNEKQNGVNPSRYGGRHIVPYDKGGEADIGDGWIPNYHVPTGYFIDWSRAAVTRLRTATVEDMKVRTGKSSKIQAGDSSKIVSRFQNSHFYWRKGVTFSWAGVYSPTFRYNAPTPFDHGSSCVFSNEIAPDIVLAFACSTAGRYVMRQFINHTINFGVDDVKELLTSSLNDSQRQVLLNLVKAIVAKQKVNQYYPYHLHEQKEIDALVYQLYGLTDEDIREVTLWYCRRYPTLARAQGVLTEAETAYSAYLSRAAVLLEMPAGVAMHPLYARIAAHETHTQELKAYLATDPDRSAEGTPGFKVARAVASFANAVGGSVLIGVRDDGSVIGLDADMAQVPGRNRDGFERKLRDLMDNFLTPAPTGLLTVTFHSLSEGDVCEVAVAAAPRTTYCREPSRTARGETASADQWPRRVFVRDGNRTVTKDGPELEEWLRSRQSLN